MAGNQAFLVTNRGDDVAWEGINGIVKTHFPKAVQDGRLSLQELEQRSYSFQVDNQTTVKTFGQLTSFEDTVVELVKQYLDLSVGRVGH